MQPQNTHAHTHTHMHAHILPPTHHHPRFYSKTGWTISRPSASTLPSLPEALRETMSKTSR
jgi:hypothetical protein